MGSRKEREYDEIIKELQGIQDSMNNLQKDAKYLEVSAGAAESTLKDRVGKKSIDAIEDLADTIRKATAQGEERILELIQQIKQDKARFEELDR